MNVAKPHCSLIALALATITTCWQTAPVRATSEPASMLKESEVGTHTTDEDLIRKQAKDYAQAFSKADIKTLASMWADDASYTDASGNLLSGRTAITKQMSAFFQANGKQPLEIIVDSISFPAGDVAIEHGLTRLTNFQFPQNTQRYNAVHVKKNNQWQMVNVTETPYRVLNNSEYLQDLSWLVGTWSAKGPGGALTLKANWVGNNNIIALNLETRTNDGSKTSQTQYIFWNPIKGKIYSWQYDWTGGYGKSWWEKAGDNWVAHARSIEADGIKASAKYVIHRIDNDTFSWQSINRHLAGRSLADTKQITLKREKA